MPHDIIDNRTRQLAPEINNFLADGSTPIPLPSATSSRPASRPSPSTSPLEQLRFLMPQTS